MSADQFKRVDGDAVEVRDGDPYDAESVPVEREQLGSPIDPPDEREPLYATITRWRDHAREPLIPAWMRNQQQRVQAAKWAAGYAGYLAGRHAKKSPKYLAKTAMWAPVGLFRLLAKQIAWWWVLEQHQLRQEAANNNDPMTWMKLHREAKTTRLWRGIVLAAELVAAATAAGLLTTYAPVYMQVLALVVLMPLLAWAGRPADKPIIDRISTGQRFIKLTAEMTRRALVACGAGVKDPADVQFPRDIYRDPPGWTAIVNLPPGVIATDVIDKRDRLAAGFRLPKTQVWPAPVDGEHPGQLQIWVADKPVNTMRQPAWPLLRQGTVDYFKPYVYGFDERMRPVTWSLDQKNSLFGGIPGSGKSLAARVVLLGAVLDPLVIPVIFELKGTGDFDMFEPMCPPGLYGSGADEPTKQQAFAGLQWLLDECDRRGPIVKQWVARGLSKTNNVNRAMAERDARLRPIVAVFDEVQELFTDKEIGKAAQAMATSIVKRGRALGIHLILATQRIDKDSIPRGVSSNIGIRLCLAVTSHVECDLVLGTGAYARGARPTEFEPGSGGDPKDSGWGWRAGLGRMGVVRAAYLDNDAAKAVVARALAMREGTLDVAEPLRTKAFNLLDDIARVWPKGQDKVWSEVLVKLLAELRPEVYGAWVSEDDDGKPVYNTSALAAALKGYDITTGQVWATDPETGRGANRRGVERADLERAITARRQGQLAGREAASGTGGQRALEH